MAQVATARFPPGFRRRGRRQLVLRNHPSPGDVLMVTVAVRDLHLCYPGLFKTDVRTSALASWENSSYVNPLAEGRDVTMELVAC